MGLQARPMLSRLSEECRGRTLALGAAILVTVIVVRLAWVVSCGAVTRLVSGRRSDAKGQDARGDVLIGWCGMRGLVTLATAFALPIDFPGRDPIVLTAFCVVLGTLVLPCLTLKPLLHFLRLHPDQSIEQGVSRARSSVMQAARDSLASATSTTAAVVRKQYAAAQTVAENAGAPQAATEYDKLRLRAIAR